MSKLVVRRCGVRFYPPAIVIVYSIQNSFQPKFHVRTIPLRNFNKDTPVYGASENLRSCERHSKYLDQIPEWQLEKLIRMIKERLNGKKKDELIKEAKEKLVIDPEQDLNKVDEETLQAKKAMMNKTFEMNRKKPGDVGFEYDLVIDFNTEDKIESHEWDDLSEMDEF